MGRKKEEAQGPPHPPRGYVLAVGGANGEYTLTPSSPYREGGKHQVRSHPLYGGSGMNYAAKLMGYGIPTIPILAAGDDALGGEIRAELLRIAAQAGLPRPVSDWVGASHFLVPKARTPRSTIVVAGGRRTIFKETVALEDRGDFLRHVDRALEALEARGIVDRVKAVMIGHLQADEPNGDGPQAPGPCTKRIVDYFHARQVPIFANFGDSQLRRGHEAWRPVLEKLEVFQLNADELVRFYGPGLELDAIVQDEMVRRSKYCVVTMDKFGALCVGAPERMNGLIVAWSSKPHKVVDTTGAGDAFLSGVVSYAYEVPEELQRRQGILRPMARGRLWAEFTCQHLGGASETPDAAKLRAFESTLPNGYADPNAVDEAHAKTILRILTTAFNREVSRPPPEA